MVPRKSPQVVRTTYIHAHPAQKALLNSPEFFVNSLTHIDPKKLPDRRQPPGSLLLHYMGMSYLGSPRNVPCPLPDE